MSCVSLHEVQQVGAIWNGHHSRSNCTQHMTRRFVPLSPHDGRIQRPPDLKTLHACSAPVTTALTAPWFFAPLYFPTRAQEEVRNILAATGKSGGISAEQILRQFNAKRFKEASKAWSAAEGSSSAATGSDPLDSLFFAPPSTPTTPPTNPSTSPPSSSQQHQHQQQHQPQPQQQPFIPEGAAPATECAGGASGSAFCSADGTGGGDGGRGRIYAARAKVQQQYRRPCPGGWVC